MYEFISAFNYYQCIREITYYEDLKRKIWPGKSDVEDNIN